MSTLNRRQLLGLGIGVAAVGIGTAAGLEAMGAPRRQRLLHDVGLNPSPDGHEPASNTPVVSGDLASHAMRRTVGWTISTPSRAVRAMVYCLHGFNADHHFAFDQIHLPDVIESQKAPLGVAAVDGGADSYWHPRADGTDALSMLLHEFIPFVEQRTKTTERALLGWSMGGYGALLAAETAPTQFFAVAAASPALWTSPGATARGAFDSASDYDTYDVFTNEGHLAGLTVRVDCGTGDPFYNADRQFVARLPPGHLGSFGPGFHEAAYWRSVAPAQITTIVSALPA